MDEWLSRIVVIVGILEATGLLGGWIWYRKETKKMKIAEVEKAQAEADLSKNDLVKAGANEWKAIAEHREEKLVLSYADLKKEREENNKLRDTIDQWRDKCNELENKLHQKDLDIIKSALTHCEVKNCQSRCPKTGY